MKRSCFSRSEGGLATGLDSLQISYEKHWIGWPGICVDNEESKEEITFRLEGINFHQYLVRNTDKELL